MVQPMSKSVELERERSKKRRDNESGVYKVWKKGCNCKEGIRMGKKKDSMSRI